MIMWCHYIWNSRKSMNDIIRLKVLEKDILFWNREKKILVLNQISLEQWDNRERLPNMSTVPYQHMKENFSRRQLFKQTEILFKDSSLPHYASRLLWLVFAFWNTTNTSFHLTCWQSHQRSVWNGILSIKTKKKEYLPCQSPRLSWYCWPTLLR